MRRLLVFLLVFWSLGVCPGQVFPKAAPLATARVSVKGKPKYAAVQSYANANVTAGDVRIFWTQAELKVWRQRAQSGPYKTLGDAYTNSPGEWGRMLSDANRFRDNPINAGSDTSNRRTIWKGYPGTVIDPGTYVYPIWQGVREVQAAFVGLVLNDTSYLMKVKRNLLAQVRRPDTTGYVTLDASKWPTGSGAPGAHPSFQTGANEGKWCQRMAQQLDYAWSVFTQAERAEVISFLDKYADFEARTMTAKFVNDGLPGIASGNLTPAHPSRMESTNNTVWWVPTNYPRYAVWDACSCKVYTGRNADGSLGYQIPFAAFSFNNRDGDRMPIILLVELLKKNNGQAQNQARLTLYKTIVKGWLTYSVFSDGTYGEYERDRDYGCNQRGVAHYGGILVESYLTGAWLLQRQGDTELRDWTTRAGVATTICQTGDTAKSLKRVAQRLAAFCQQSKRLYAGAVLDSNLIQINDPLPTQFGDGNWTHDHLLDIAGKLWPDLNYKNVYQRRAAGTSQLPTSGYSPAKGIPRFFMGTGATFPSFPFMYGGMENCK